MNSQKLKRIWKGFWQLADPKIWIASTVPIFIGSAYAYSLTGKFNFYWFLWTLLGIYSLEIGKNAVNEVIDYSSGVDRFVSPEKRTPFSGGKKTIVEGKLTIQETIIIACLTIVIGSLIGLYISFFHQFKIFWIGIIGVFLAVSYSLPPLKLAYRGLGELTVGITFGPLITTGAYLVQTSNFSFNVILISLPVGFLITNVLWINQYPDYEADKKGNKQNWLVRLGKEKGILVYNSLFICTYLSVIIIAFIFKNLIWLLPFISLPLAWKAVKTAKNHYDNISKLVTANLKTVQTYQLIGLTMTLAAFLDRFI